jgi:hypothetical protein
MPQQTDNSALPIRNSWSLQRAKMKDWFLENGCWYLGSATFHAVALFCIGLIAIAMPHAVSDQAAPPPVFETPAADASEVDIAKFDLGNAPLEITKLDISTLEQLKALPAGRSTHAIHDTPDADSDEGGGRPSDQAGPELGGMGGPSVANLPGPGGEGGVGTGHGTGNSFGSGGPGEGFGQRFGRHRDTTPAGERAVGAALNWIARHQTPQGKWSLDFRHQCKGGTCSGPGAVQSDVAATAMAILPFLGAGQTQKSKGIYRQTISKGLTWLMRQEDRDGKFADHYGERPMYAQGLATIALCEAYGMTRDESVGAAARRAVAYVQRAQNPGTGGWRYHPGESGDTSVFGWQIMALKSAQLAGLAVDSLVFDNAQKWLRSVARGDHRGLYAYQPYREVSPTMTAVGLLCRQYLGVDPKDPSVIEGKSSLMENLPDPKTEVNCYYWYYATLAMHNFIDADWDAWNRKMRRTLIESQAREGCATGSWDPDKPTADAWGALGGRLMTTSFNALTLEVPYRYSALFRTDPVSRKQGNKGIPKPADAE